VQLPSYVVQYRRVEIFFVFLFALPLTADDDPLLLLALRLGERPPDRHGPP
jgi:hypothetical protein